MSSVSHIPNRISTISSIGIVSILCGTICVGQLARVPLAQQGGGLLVSDIGVGIVLLYGAIAAFLGAVPIGKLIRALRIYCYTVAPFFMWAFSVLVAHEYALGVHSFFIASLYLIRLCALSLLFPLLCLFVSAKAAQIAFLWMYGALLALGYAQLAVLPSLVGNINGWDPHIHRMVGTWFDPNFFGACIAMGILPVLYWSRGNIILLAASLGALALTGSRSSWIAVIAAICLTAFVFLLQGSITVYWKKGVYLGLLLGCLSCIGIGSLFFDRISTFFVHDPTVALRATAYADTWHRLVEPNIVFGVGYNAYQFSAKEAGLIQDFSIHSRAGSDNSVVTLLVTTGIIGTLLFFIPFLCGLYWHGRQWLLYKKSNSLVFIWSMIVLVTHAQFENSLLYPHLLMTFILIAIATL